MTETQDDRPIQIQRFHEEHGIDNEIVTLLAEHGTPNRHGFFSSTDYIPCTCWLDAQWAYVRLHTAGYQIIGGP